MSLLGQPPAFYDGVALASSSVSIPGREDFRFRFEESDFFEPDEWGLLLEKVGAKLIKTEDAINSDVCF